MLDSTVSGTPEDVHAAAFIARWQGVTASELSTAQSFVSEFCALLGVDKPHPTPAQDYMFERPVTFMHGDGTTRPGRIDCYRRGAFVLEAKKLRAGFAPKGFDDAMMRARAQAEGYARALPAGEGRPLFLVLVDVGNVIELYAEFTRSGATYTPFPDPRSHRIPLAGLADAKVLARLRLLWTDPQSLDPARASARVTREVSVLLAELARSLEAAGHRADHVAAFLTRCLFSMFAEDVELLPKGSFLGFLQSHRGQPATLMNMLRVLWADMDRGGFSAALAGPVLRFNGKLFKAANADGYVLLLDDTQIGLLITAAKSNWREVEPAIFGTLLERALEPTERHALGAHYTPRAYVERLVLPTVVELLRADWADVQAASLVLAADSKLGEARDEIRKFHHRLCTVRVLDPACGSGNFLYVTLEHLKRLEGEVLNQLEAMGETQDKLALEGETVTPQQLRGIEINERAAALAELVLWIGYLQWHIRTRGNKAVAEPVIHDYGNIEHRDAVLAWADLDLARDADGRTLMRWDGQTRKAHPVTGHAVPDEAAQVPQWRYIRPAQAAWPRADFIVGNPPFIGASTMRAALGDGYVQALRGAWPEVPESADFVMYWWSRAAALVAAGSARSMGLITTNSLRQTFNRRVVQAALGKGLTLSFAIPDHPWVDNTNGAAVRIAMTVAVKAAATVAADGAGALSARLLTVTHETTGEFGEVAVLLAETLGVIHADLSIGVNVASAMALLANGGISSRGVMLFGAGFIVTPEEATQLLSSLSSASEGSASQRIIREYRNGRDLTDMPRGVKVIDLFGLDAQQVRDRYPAVYQRLLDRVRPEREAKGTSKDGAGYAKLWWLHGKPRQEMRKQLFSLPRYIATVETAKHRTFQFLDANILPDNMLIAIASDNACYLGVLSASVHVTWALAQGGTLEDRPRYNKSRCFETFPFPDTDTGLTPALRERIAGLAEQIDAHRKRQQALHPGLTLTGMYNVLELVRAHAASGGEGRELTPKEKAIHAQGLVGVLRELHDELDAAVLAAYDLSDVPQAEWLQRLVLLNARRAAEERQGTVRWLRPAFQHPQAQKNKELLAPTRSGLQAEIALEPKRKAGAGIAAGTAWPATLPEQVRSVALVLASGPAALSVAEIEKRFKGRGPWKRSLPRILETLEALGRAQRDGDGWRS